MSQIEWESDDTVVGIEADLIAEIGTDFNTNLHDEGSMIQLVNPLGQITDTANMFPEGVSGWVAGSPVSHATMERTLADQLATPENWHTNLGLFRSGADASGNPWLGTPRYPNSPLVERSIDETGARLLPRNHGDGAVLSFADSAAWSLNPDDWIVVLSSPTGSSEFSLRRSPDA